MTQFADDIGFLGSRDDDEGLFSRDVAGQLVRLDAPTESDYGKKVTVQIDGQSVSVPLAEPLKDAQGNIVLDIDGRTTPRYTTIFDAATKLYGEKRGEESRIPIPVLCHQPHMQPATTEAALLCPPHGHPARIEHHQRDSRQQVGNQEQCDQRRSQQSSGFRAPAKDPDAERHHSRKECRDEPA